MEVFKNETGWSLTGNRIGVFQDVFLHLGDDGEDGDGERQERGGSHGFVVDRPFLMVIELGGEVAAVGRIADPTWERGSKGGDGDDEGFWGWLSNIFS